MENKQNEEYRYYSVSEFAKKLGRSTTYVYSQIAEGRLDTIPYTRGKYNGFVIREKI